MTKEKKTENYVRDILGMDEQDVKEIQTVLFNQTQETEFIKGFNSKRVF